MSVKSRVVAAIPSQRARTVGAFTALTVALATLAILHDGVEVSDLDLHDGGVWVTNLDLNGVPMAAHLNYESRELDSYTELASTDSDVSQEANEVVLHDLRGHGIQSVDTATWVPSSTAKLPKVADATQGSGVVAVADPVAGSVWALPAGETSTFDPASLAPVLNGEVGVRAVVGKDDVIHTVAPDGTLRDLTRTGTEWTVVDVGSTPPIADGDDVALSAVGGTGVVLNKTAGWVAWPDHHTDLDGAESLELQQPGVEADVIALAGPSGLLQVPLDGDDPADPISTPAGGRPAAPVVVGTCTYAAWAGTGWYVRDCAEDSDDISQAYPEQLSRRGVPNSRLVFRTNRDVVTLNDVGNGDIILVNENMLLLDDPWETIRQEIEQDEQDDRNEETIEFRRNKKNEPPQPTDDDFGVRAGRPVTIPVLGNDTDPDGDILTLSLPDGSEKVPGLGEVQLVRDARAVRLVVDEDASGTRQFEYIADDGRPNGTARATVSVTVRPPELNDGVRLVTPKRPSKMTIRQRGAGEHHILQEWVDLDGDPFWVDRVDFPKGMTGTFRPDGYIRVVDDGRERPGERTVAVTLTDGRDSGTVPVDLTVTVKPVDGRTDPVAQADFVTALVGQEVHVRPLRNDVDPGSGDLYLELDREIPRELEVTQNNDDSLSITGQKAGTHYIEYAVSNGGGTATAVIRVDVVAPQNARPIPDDDLAVLPAGGEVLVPVLANDTDPGGGILVLESVNLDRVDGVTAEVVDHELLRIRGRGLGNQTATVPYVVSNGTLNEVGTVTVVPDNRERSGAPVAGDDTGVVRAGDVVSVDVLANDVSPADRRLRVEPEVEVTQGAQLGQAFVSEDKVRFVANGEEGDARIRYDVTDPLGNVDSGIVRISIRPTGPNSAPEPKSLTARLFQGGKTDIQVPLAGIDPDGDSATLVGLQEAPTKGSVEVDGDTLTYTATLPGSSEIGSNYLGTDTFTYLVEDPHGAIGEGQVRVGIAQPPSTNRPPVAITDERRVRPDRLVAVPVTVNDIDPEGEPLTLTDAATLEGDVEVEIVNGRLEFRTPAEPGTLRIGYTIEDQVGAVTDGQLVVNVDPDARALPPIARDDRVPLSEVVGREEVTVDVLANDEDPDGAISALDPVTEVDGVEADADGRLRIPLRKERQVVVYSLTDADGEVGRAVVLVPGTDSPAAKRPVLAPDAEIPIEVTAGEEVRIPLAKYVAVRQGREPTLPFAENIHAGPGHDGSALKPDDDNVIVFGAEPKYFGPTSVTATVADSTGEDDADAQSSVITFPIWVKPGGSTQPQLRIPEITVSKEEPWVGDLASLATDPDPGDQERLEFRIDDEDSGLDVALSDDTLTVALGGGAEPGTQLHFDLVVTDGSTGDVRQQVVVQVLETTRPPITTRPAELDAEAGETTEVDLADYATNPFEEEGESLKVVGEPTAVPDDAEVSVSGTTVRVTPAEDYSGTMVVTYVLRDATDLEEREAQGEILLHVRGRPDAPSAPTADPTESKTVQVDWQAGDNNGAPITGYTLEWRGAGGSNSVKINGAATSHTVTGLTNAEPYQFRVIATNEVGDSEPSEWSREATPDQVPVPPSNVTASFGDGKLEVSWTQPAYEGSDVHTYEVSYNGRITTTGGLKTTIEGLTNGTDYRIKVRGINDSEPITDGKQGASAWSTEVVEHPNGEPVVPTAPEIVADGPDADPSALISWTYDDSGHEISKYEVRRSGGATVACRKESTTSCRVDLREGQDDSFQVRLFNRDNPRSGAIDGWGPWSAATAAVRGAKEPGPVRNLNVTPTGSSEQARVTFSGADLHGAESVQYYYRVGGGSAQPISSPAVIGGLTNGSNVDVFVWAVTTANGQQSAPGPERSDGVSAFAPCSVSVSRGTSGYESHTFNWSVNSNGRSCSWSGDGPGGAPQGSGNSGGGQVTKSAPAGGRTTLTVTVRTSTSGEDPGVGPQSASATGEAWAPSYDDWEPTSEPCSRFGGNCVWTRVTLTNWRPNSDVYCFIGGVGAPDWQHTFHVGESGGGTWGRPNTWQWDPRASQYHPDTYDGKLCQQR